MQNLIYWSPFLGNVGTVKSTLNSALAFKKFSKNKYNVKIINVFGEWNNYKNILSKLGIKSTFGLTIGDIIEGIRWQDHEV